MSTVTRECFLMIVVCSVLNVVCLHSIIHTFIFINILDFFQRCTQLKRQPFQQSRNREGEGERHIRVNREQERQRERHETED